MWGYDHELPQKKVNKSTWKVYVIHFDKPYKHARHYTGIAKNVPKRMKEHKGGYGSKLMKVLKENNIGFRYNIIAEYPTFSEAKQHEKNLKTKIKKPQRYCPICKELKNCKHESTIGDNYGLSCSICNKILEGYGYGGFLGFNMIKGRKCKHKFDNEETCVYCERNK